MRLMTASDDLVPHYQPSVPAKQVPHDEPDVTVCFQCVHARVGVWVGNPGLCYANPTTRNVVSGVVSYKTCAEVNDGHCPQFEPIPPREPSQLAEVREVFRDKHTPKPLFRRFSDWLIRIF